MGGFCTVCDSGDLSLHIAILFSAVSLYSSMEIIPISFLTFKRYSGLYFWSLQVSSLGVAISSVSHLFAASTPGRPWWLTAVLGAIDWPMMVTGQSLVLYSRLHLLSVKPSILRRVLCLIIFNAVTIHTTSIALNFMATAAPGKLPAAYMGFGIFEKMQVTIFFCQEMLLSAIYLWKAPAIIIHDKPAATGNAQDDSEQRQYRHILSYLIGVNVCVSMLDIAILVFAYLDLYILQTSYKTFIYGLKLKVEISILNRLADFVHQKRRSEPDNGSRITPQMEREWDTILERSFGASAE